MRTPCIQSFAISPADAIYSNSPQRRPASRPSAASTSSPARSSGASAGHSRRRLRAAFSNIGLQVTWCAQGKEAAEYWGRLFNVDVTWFDPELSAAKQLALVEEIASEKWDFVAIQAVDIDTITAPVVRMIEAGIPVIDMDTLIAPLDQIDVLTFLAPDNEFMGAAVTQALVDAIGGQGTIIMTQGALGHTGAQGRAQRLPIGHRQVSRCRGPGDRFGGLGRRENSAAVGGGISTRSRRSMPRSSTTTTWRLPQPAS